MHSPDFVYVTYIRSTPQKIFSALTTTEFTRQYWNVEMQSQWTKGSKWTAVNLADSNADRVTGEIIESDPPRKLSYSWSRASDASDPANVSRVTFEIEPLGEMTRLTVTHDRLTAGSYMDSRIRQGWPRVLASLKSLLETGKPLDTWIMPETKCA